MFFREAFNTWLLDFEKANECVNWDFLHGTIIGFGFLELSLTMGGRGSIIV